MSAKFTSKYYVSLFYFIIILLTILNLNIYLSSKKTKVLGAEINNYQGIYWYNFLKDNPNYIPGWLEIDRPDKAKNIDPNYL